MLRSDGLALVVTAALVLLLVGGPDVYAKVRDVDRNAEPRAGAVDESAIGGLVRWFDVAHAGDLSASPTPSPEPTAVAVPPEPVVSDSPPVYAPEPVVPVVPKTEIEALVCRYFGDHCAKALRVMWCESGGRPEAIGPGGNYGLFQLNQVHAKRWPEFWTSWLEPEWNVSKALFLWSNQGWAPWGCRGA